MGYTKYFTVDILHNQKSVSKLFKINTFYKLSNGNKVVNAKNNLIINN